MDDRIFHPVPIRGGSIRDLTASKGIVSLPILLLSFTILSLVVGAIPIYMNSSSDVSREWDCLQARNNAEAGIWLGIENWMQESTDIHERLYVLPSGSAVVTVISVDSQLIQISSTGRTYAEGKDGMKVVYNIHSKQFVHWDHAVN